MDRSSNRGKRKADDTREGDNSNSEKSKPLVSKRPRFTRLPGPQISGQPPAVEKLGIMAAEVLAPREDLQEGPSSLRYGLAQGGIQPATMGWGPPPTISEPQSQQELPQSEGSTSASNPSYKLSYLSFDGSDGTYDPERFRLRRVNSQDWEEPSSLDPANNSGDGDILQASKSQDAHPVAGSSKQRDTHPVQNANDSNINREHTIPKRYQWERGEKVGAYLSHKYARDIQIFIPRDKGSSYDISGALVHMKIIDPTSSITQIDGSRIKKTKKVGNWKVDKII